MRDYLLMSGLFICARLITFSVRLLDCVSMFVFVNDLFLRAINNANLLTKIGPHYFCDRYG